MIGSHKNRREIKLEQTVANLMRFKSGIYNNMVVEMGASPLIHVLTRSQNLKGRWKI